MLAKEIAYVRIFNCPKVIITLLLINVRVIYGYALSRENFLSYLFGKKSKATWIIFSKSPIIQN